jgi:uncharacterized protein
MGSKNTYTFPEFKKLEISDRETIEAFTEKYPPYSDFSVLSMLSWNAADDNAFSVLHNNLVIKLKDYLGDGYNYSFIGTENPNESLEELFKITDVIGFVPEFVAETVDKKKYLVEEDRDSFDYIIDIGGLSGLSGGTYKSLRRSIREFTGKFSGYTVRELDLRRDKRLILDLTKLWCSLKDFDKEKTDEDVETVEKFIKYSKGFNVFSFGLFVSGSLIAFTLNELKGTDWAMGHFGKSDNRYNNSSFVMEHETAKKLWEMGYRHINLQQDTGLLGLREAKSALKPAYYLKKYTIKKA